MANAVYTIVLEPAEEGGYTVWVPVLPGCVTEGDTYEEALAMAEDAIGLWLQTFVDDGKPIPVEPADFAVRVEQVAVPLPPAT